MRAFATKAEDVDRRVDMVMKMIEKALCIKIFGKFVFSRIDVFIPRDSRYPCDCGQTKQALLKRIKANPSMKGKVYVTEIFRGDIFCEVLNYGIAHQLEHGIHYSVIASPEVFSYKTMQAVLEKAANGALAVGVAIDELTESILAGQLANTFCLWRNKSLQQVGHFDLAQLCRLMIKTQTTSVLSIQELVNLSTIK